MLNFIASLAIAISQAQAVQPPLSAEVISDEANYGVGSQESKAQVAFTQEEAIAFGIAHSPLLAAARARVDAGRGRLLSARSLLPLEFDPGLSIGGEEAVAVVTQVFEISGRRSARTAVARYELQIDQRQFDAAERDLVRDIKVAYADVVAAQSALIVATGVTDVIRRLRDSVQKQVEVGEVPAQELVKADIELSRAELENLRAQSVLDRAGQVFNVTIGRAVELPATASEPTSFARSSPNSTS